MDVQQGLKLQGAHVEILLLLAYLLVLQSFSKNQALASAALAFQHTEAVASISEMLHKGVAPNTTILSKLL